MVRDFERHAREEWGGEGINLKQALDWHERKWNLGNKWNKCKVGGYKREEREERREEGESDKLQAARVYTNTRRR